MMLGSIHTFLLKSDTVNFNIKKNPYINYTLASIMLYLPTSKYCSQSIIGWYQHHPECCQIAFQIQM